MGWVFWAVFGGSLAAIFLYKLKPSLTWRWTTAQTNLGIDYTGLPKEQQDLFGAVMARAYQNNTISENELIMQLFTIYENIAFPHTALVHPTMMPTTINYITAKLQANPSMQPLGDIYLGKLLLAMTLKYETIENQAHKDELFKCCKYINQYLLKYNVEYRAGMMKSLARLSM